MHNADIKGFKHNDNLIIYVENYNFNINDIYYIFLDCVPDNPSVVDLINRLNIVCSKHKNVVNSNNLCFEYLILRFIDFEKWTRPIKRNKDYEAALIIRNKFIHCVESNKRWTLDKQILEYVCKYKNIDASTEIGFNKLSNLTFEKVATLLLSKLTGAGPLGFQVTKTVFNTCWTCDCKDKCKHSMISNHKDIYTKCNLNKLPVKKTSQAKAYDLWYGTEVHNIIK